MAALQDTQAHVADADPAPATRIATEELSYLRGRQLVRSALNVRNRASKPDTDSEKLSHAELKALIKSQGLLQNLIVMPVKSRSKLQQYGVVAGGRRLRCILELIAEGHFSPDDEFLCRIVADPVAAVAMSMAENSGREPMTVADTVAAFAEMVEAGATVDDLALCFGLTPLTVQRRLKLANVSPVILAIFRDGGMALDQVEALALTDDHATQERVWSSTPHYDREAYDLRRLILGTAVDAKRSAVVKYVTLAAYEAAGGPVIRDLFSEDDAGHVADPELLQKLALDKLEPKLAKLRREGWAWVEVMFTYGYAESQRFTSAPLARREPTPAEQKAISAARKAHEKAEAALEAFTQDDNCDEDEAGRLDSLVDAAQRNLDELLAKLNAITPEVMALAGVIVTIDRAGKVVSHRGLVKPEDRKAAAKTATASRGEGEAGGDDESSDEAPTLSESLCRKLTSHRTRALQVVLADNEHVALAALAHALVPKLVLAMHFGTDSALDIQARGCAGDLARNADDLEESRAWSELDARIAAWRGRIPADAAQVLPWLIAQPHETLVSLLALCSALAVVTVTSREVSHPGDELAAAVGLDMADWWTPTAGSYLSQVPKARAAEAVTEAVSAEACAGFDKLKKGEAVARAEQLLAGRRWLPRVLRTRAA